MEQVKIDNEIVYYHHKHLSEYLINALDKLRNPAPAEIPVKKQLAMQIRKFGFK
jgi:hypothetical protein